MSFYMQGINNHEPMPAGKIFKEPVVEKTATITPVRAIDENEHRDHTEKQGHKQ